MSVPISIVAEDQTFDAPVYGTSNRKRSSHFDVAFPGALPTGRAFVPRRSTIIELEIEKEQEQEHEQEQTDEESVAIHRSVCERIFTCIFGEKLPRKNVTTSALMSTPLLVMWRSLGVLLTLVAILLTATDPAATNRTGSALVPIPYGILCLIVFCFTALVTLRSSTPGNESSDVDNGRAIYTYVRCAAQVHSCTEMLTIALAVLTQRFYALPRSHAFPLEFAS